MYEEMVRLYIEKLSKEKDRSMLKREIIGLYKIMIQTNYRNTKTVGFVGCHGDKLYTEVIHEFVIDDNTVIFHIEFGETGINKICFKISKPGKLVTVSSI